MCYYKFHITTTAAGATVRVIVHWLMESFFNEIDLNLWLVKWNFFSILLCMWIIFWLECRFLSMWACSTFTATTTTSMAAKKKIMKINSTINHWIYKTNYIFNEIMQYIDLVQAFR